MAAERTPDPPDGDSRYLSVAQVARHLGCSVSLVQKWRRLGWISATRLGPPEVPVYGYLPEDVERFVSKRWNRRRGRPPGSTSSSPTLAPQPVRRAAVSLSTPPAAQPPTMVEVAPASPVRDGIIGATTPATRPLFLWDGDPQTSRPLILARFAPHELEYALSVAAAWSRRYPIMILGEAASAGEDATILATWHNGDRLPAP